MYLQILKKDLKRKKTMNVILLIFIILAAMFMASSINNLVSVMNALDNFLEKAGIPDYAVCFSDENAVEEFESFAKSNQYDYSIMEMLQVDHKDIKIDAKEFDYSNTVTLSSLYNSTKVFDSRDKEITTVNDGEIYVTAALFYDDKYGLKEGDTVSVTVNGKTKEFILKGCIKDALFGSTMIGMTRILISENDLAYLKTDSPGMMYFANIFTDDDGYEEKYNSLTLSSIFNIDKNGVKTMYIMDMITAAVMLIVSVCLILISVVILRFTIHFTMREEFREIGVMKAIGIHNRKIRKLYIVKYFAISLVGAGIGLILSIPFGYMLIFQFSKKIIMSNEKLYILNIICAFMTAAVVVMFCYFCTRKIKYFSPIDAIRNGENGERYQRKSIISLGKTRLAPVAFMAVNDIFSGLRRFLMMILIFTLGLLLIIIPLNTINTIQSDHLISWFNMAECDHVINNEFIFTSDQDNKKTIDDRNNEVKELLLKNNIKAGVYTETVFRMSISYDGKTTSSLTFQGSGDVTTDMYTYLRGTAPQNPDEIAVTQLIADKIGADIGDIVEIKNGEQTKQYMITAIYQSMNNMGEGIRFHQEEEIDYRYIFGSFGIQIKYYDEPDNTELNRRKDLLQESYPEREVYTAGEYIDYMIGDVSTQLNDIKQMILLVVLCINILVTVLMVKSFITREKGEIAMLKAIGFKNSALIAWQTLRIGIVLLISIVLGVLLSTPLSKVTIEPIFKIMGAYSIAFEIVPIDVYVIYPLIVFCVTVLAGMLAALQIRKISASETANVE